jgi:hypothetical protein
MRVLAAHSLTLTVQFCATPLARQAQGEMSATVMRYASEWAALLPALRQRVLTGASTTSAAAPPADLKLGIG